MKNFDDVMLNANPEFTAWANGFRAIVDTLGIEQATTGFTTADVFAILSHTDNVYAHENDIVDGERSYTRMARGADILGEFIGNARNDKSRSIRLGKLLRSKVGNVYADWELVDTHKSDRQKSKIYALRWRGDADNDPSKNGQNESLSDPDKKLLETLDGQKLTDLTSEGLVKKTGVNSDDIPRKISDLKKKRLSGATCT